MVLSRAHGLALLALLGCAPRDDDEPDSSPPPPRDTGWVLYEAPDTPWRALSAPMFSSYVVSPGGELLADSCVGDALRDDGACVLGPFAGIDAPVDGYALFADLSGTSIHMLLAGGVAYGGLTESFVSEYVPLPWPPVTDVGTLARGGRMGGPSGEPCRCALAVGDPVECLDMERRPCEGLDGLLDDAVALATGFSSLAVLKADGSAWVASAAEVVPLGAGPYTHAQFGGVAGLALVTASGTVENWWIVPDFLGHGPLEVTLDPLTRPAVNAVLASGRFVPGEVCWIDADGRAHFDLPSSEVDAAPWAWLGPQFPALPTAFTCSFTSQVCALVEGRLLCAYRGGLEGDDTYGFTELMARSGSRLE